MTSLSPRVHWLDRVIPIANRALSQRLMRGSSLRLGIAFGIISVFHANRALAAVHGDDVEVALKVEHETFSLGEPVVVELGIYNGLNDTLLLDLGVNFKGALALTLTKPDGRRERARLPAAFDQFGAIGRLALKSHANYSAELVLNDWQTFDQVGRYEVTVELPPADGPEGMRQAKLAASTHFKVTPRDTAQLAAACDVWAAAAVKRFPLNVDLGTIEKSLDHVQVAGEALRVAADDVCLPAMVRVLKALDGFHARHDVILGFSQLGSAAAVATLVDSWHELDDGIRAEVLTEFQRGGRGELLRGALEHAGQILSKPLSPPT